MSELLRVYWDPGEIGKDGYPYVWHGMWRQYEANGPPPQWHGTTAVKDLIREQAGNRCERCGHPYEKGMGEWSPCDGRCTHRGPVRIGHPHGGHFDPFSLTDTDVLYEGTAGELTALHSEATDAQWRILTVHHLNGVKHDLRWWNLAALCQRCHLAIQGRVVMDRVWPWEHSDWFKPHAAGWYAWAYLGENLSREETMSRLDELLDLERVP